MPPTILMTWLAPFFLRMLAPMAPRALDWHWTTMGLPLMNSSAWLQEAQHEVPGAWDVALFPFALAAHIDQLDAAGTDLLGQLGRMGQIVGIQGQAVLLQHGHRRCLEVAGNIVQADVGQRVNGILQIGRIDDQVEGFLIVQQPASPAGQHLLRDVDGAGHIAGRELLGAARVDDDGIARGQSAKREQGNIAGCGPPLSTLGPTLLTFFISAKYLGASGWPSSSASTKASSSSIWKAQPKSFS